ncbi:indolepyruvate ferredoxin oxidoreductase beta subunit [Methanolinea mesophila]|uniref:indolepyruvate oxidoreductase subunit beta n=1 Tax=Methanolinea mesophila TaxID=547055 RepID=UPI001AE76EC3|nr:indolepyruvate oxidoreductase subunit beta [Methanolinea mesophila]MBP1928557.1 indolepyruvate ferredoxin oxidoreductase beta subunit [Methanolinea mesophila]
MTREKSFDVIIVGIGGQGTILASNILGSACLLERKPVKGAETHGMAQRGGSVESHIRIGGVFGPLIPPGTADLLIGFDLLEARRYAHYLRPEGVMVVNRQLVVPTSVHMAGTPPPTITQVEEALEGFRLCLVDAEALAVQAGSPLTQNVVMMGAASHFLPLGYESLRKAMELQVPAKTVETNIRAFELGRDAGKECGDRITPR